MKRLPPFWQKTLFSAGVIFVARIGGAASVVLALWLMTRALPPADVGIVVAAQSAAMVFAILGTLNMEGGALRYLPHWQESAPGKVRAFVFAIGRQSSLGLPLAAIAAALLLAVITTAPTSVAIATALSVPCAAALRISTQVSHGLNRPRSAAIAATFVRPLLFVLSLVALTVTGTLTALTATIAAAGALLLTAVGQAILVRRAAFSGAPVTVDAKEAAGWRATGVSLVLSVLLIDQYPAVVSLAAGTQLSDDELAAFSVALRLAMLLQMMAAAVVMSIGPPLSRAVAAGDLRTAASLASGCVKLVSGLALLAAVGLVVLAEPLLAIFGEGYGEAAPVLRVLTVMPVAGVIFGQGLLVLTAAGENGAIIKATTISVATLILAIWIGGFFGMMGVAVALIVAQVIWCGLLALEAKTRVGINPVLWASPAVAVR